MEQHPVPQNVTTFQFRLIGDMTIKQFGYLCAGAILAFIAYRLPLPFLFTWPLAFAFAFLGVGFAFIPVEERPMDVWVFSFFKSIYNPTQYVWIKEPPKAEPVATPAAPKTTTTSVIQPTPRATVPPTTVTPKTVLSTLYQPQPNAHSSTPSTHTATVVTTHPKASLFSWLSDLWAPKPVRQPLISMGASMPTPVPVTGHKVSVPLTAHPTHDGPSVADNAATHQRMKQLEDSLKDLQSKLSTKNVVDDRVLELQTQLTDVLKQKTDMENELMSLKRKAVVDDDKSKQTEQIRKDNEAGPAAKSKVTVISNQADAVKVGLPRLTNVANVITGLVKDDTNNQLPGILVTVTNNEGVPMRALKTNKLGQFAASTPLGSGVYFVEIEDPRDRFTFSRVQITLNGTVVPAIEIIAKSQKQLTREKLAQEIFGGNNL